LITNVTGDTRLLLGHLSLPFGQRAGRTQNSMPALLPKAKKKAPATWPALLHVTQRCEHPLLAAV
jgi:hypothetical protein